MNTKAVRMFDEISKMAKKLEHITDVDENRQLAVEIRFAAICGHQAEVRRLKKRRVK